MKNYDILEDALKSADIELSNSNEKLKPACFESPNKSVIFPNFQDLAELDSEAIKLKSSKRFKIFKIPDQNSPENKVTKVVKAKWNKKFSCMVVNGKTYRLSEDQRKKLEKMTPVVQV